MRLRFSDYFRLKRRGKKARFVSGSHMDFARVSVVLVDDNWEFCNAVHSLLELEGYHIECRTSGRELLAEPEVFRNADFLICDYYMPDMNGLDVIKAVRVLEPNLPAALLTGSRESHIVSAAAKVAGCCAVLYKPIEPEALAQAIDSYRRRPADAPRKASSGGRSSR
jgi:CheY-like chemotaxis protein